MSIAAAGVLTLMLLGAPEPTQNPAREAARVELSAPGYQTELPGEDPAAAPADKNRPRDRGHLGLPSSAPLAHIARGLLWILILVSGLVIVVWLLRELFGFSAAPPPAVDAAEKAAAVEAVVAQPLRDAETLAAQGHFGEAIHVLLLRTLQALVDRGRLDLPPSLTSREVIAHVQLPADADTALRGLVGAVEVSHFGGETPGPSEWQACLDQFHRFARAFGGAA